MKKRERWSTPQKFFDALHRRFMFTLDVCADKTNAKCLNFFNKSQDGLQQPWRKNVCWMNPPFDRRIHKWVRKAYESSTEGATVVCLLPAGTDTSWFHEYVAKYGHIIFLRGRLTFSGVGRAPFATMLAIFYPPDAQLRMTLRQKKMGLLKSMSVEDIRKGG